MKVKEVNIEVKPLLAHIIFTPSTVPQNGHEPRQPYNYSHQMFDTQSNDSTEFLKLLTTTTSKLPANFKKLIPNTLTSVEAWSSYMPTFKQDKIKEQIASLKSGTLLPFYLEKQNVAMLLRKP